MHKFFEDKLFSNSSVIELLENWSHGQHDECLLDSKPTVKSGFRLNNCEDVTPPVETIIGVFRCFSYFLQFESSLYRMDFSLIL